MITSDFSISLVKQVVDGLIHTRNSIVDYISFLDLIEIVKTINLDFPVWFWFRGHDMTDFEEVNSNACVLDMVKHI